MELTHPDNQHILVGQRFVGVSGNNLQLDVDHISEWPWQSGVIRAASHKDIARTDLKNYKLLVGKAFLGSRTYIQFLGDKSRDFLEEDLVKPVRDRNTLKQFVLENPSVNREFQDLIRKNVDESRVLQGAKSLIGTAIKVYSMDPATQWFTATIVHATSARILEVKCEQVPALKCVDPSLIHVDIVHTSCERNGKSRKSLAPKRICPDEEEKYDVKRNCVEQVPALKCIDPTLMHVDMVHTICERNGKSRKSLAPKRICPDEEEKYDVKQNSVEQVT
ncbi:lysine-specific demethylase 3A-A-like isoform X3 [Ascaphus truei]|uniref:lysine-specific demethylase 3A-A-like isoform X3 n=1 Tax=Ascaphus truei TaxID=8439 RepID=UPI003F594CF9